MFWDRESETLERPQLERLQLERWRRTVRRVGRRVPFYRERFAALGVRADDLASLEDARRLPFTTAADLYATYPDGLLAAAAFDGEVEHLAALRRQLTERLKTELYVRPKVDLVPAGSLPVAEGKAKRVIDKRCD